MAGNPEPSPVPPKSGMAELSATGEVAADRRGQYSWALFEFGRSPYISLVYIYVFPPYFANVVVGDAVRGQEAWSLANTVVGVCVALLAPLLGAIADRTGPRKPWLAGIVAVMAPCCFALWWAMPGAHSGLPVPVILGLIIVLATAFQFSDAFHSSMLASIATPGRIGSLSGLGISTGNAGTLVALVVMLLGVALPASGVTLGGILPDHPLFGLDTAKYEHDRIAGPIAAIWMLIFVLPLFIWTPDRKKTGIAPGRAMREGLIQLWTTIRRTRHFANVMLFLLARMIYTDGKVAVLAYAGIYAAGIFGWTLTNMLLFGLILAPCAIFGGLLGGWIDDRYGSKRAIQMSISATCVGMIGAISTTPHQIFFLPYDSTKVGPLWAFPYFRTLPEVVYVCMFMVLAATITAAFANSRSMLARIAPISMMSQFYGLYGLSGTATSFLGHGLVASFTLAFHSQRAGFASIIILLCTGLAVMHWVNEERSQESAIV